MLNNPWIRNRFTLTFGAIAIVVLAWNVYVAFNNDGHVSGIVLDADGQPAADARVVLARRTVTSVSEIAETQTDSEGRYGFGTHGQYALVITANAAGGAPERRVVPLWFRNQNVDVAPIVLPR